jgi:hypothetical protein
LGGEAKANAKGRGKTKGKGNDLVASPFGRVAAALRLALDAGLKPCSISKTKARAEANAKARAEAKAEAKAKCGGSSLRSE